MPTPVCPPSAVSGRGLAWAGRAAGGRPFGRAPYGAAGLCRPPAHAARANPVSPPASIFPFSGFRFARLRASGSTPWAASGSDRLRGFRFRWFSGSVENSRLRFCDRARRRDKMKRGKL